MDLIEVPQQRQLRLPTCDRPDDMGNRPSRVQEVSTDVAQQVLEISSLGHTRRNSLGTWQPHPTELPQHSSLAKLERLPIEFATRAFLLHPSWRGHHNRPAADHA